MISTYSRSMTSDPLMSSSIIGGGLSSASHAAALSSSPPKKYGPLGGGGGGGVGPGGLAAAVGLGGSDEWSDATWLNNLRISAGMDPIPMPSSNSVASKVGCFKKKIQCDKKKIRDQDDAL